MSYFHFDDNSIKKDFRQIARTDCKSRKIDSNTEKEKLAEYLSGVKGKISRHDEALLNSTALNFDNKKVKRDFKSFAKLNGNKQIDTQEEYNLLKDYLNKNSNNLSVSDQTLIINMLNAYKPDITVNIEGNNNIINLGDINATIEGNVVNNGQLTIGVGNTQNMESDGEISTDENSVENDISNELPVTENLSQESAPAQEEKSVDVVIKKGDYWYKLIQENYNISDNDETMKLVRHFKKEYFEQNRDELIRQGHTSDKSNFFYEVDDVVKFPQNIEIDGNTYSLR